MLAIVLQQGQRCRQFLRVIARPVRIQPGTDIVLGFTVTATTIARHQRSNDGGGKCEYAGILSHTIGSVLCDFWLYIRGVLRSGHSLSYIGIYSGHLGQYVSTRGESSRPFGSRELRSSQR